MDDPIRKTAVIWNEFSDGIKLLLVEGDWSRFQGVYINAADSSDELQQELSSRLYDEEMVFAIPEVNRKEFAEEIRLGAEIVECGFLP